MDDLKGIQYFCSRESYRAGHKGMLQMQGNDGIFVWNDGTMAIKPARLRINVNSKTFGLGLRDNHDVRFRDNGDFMLANENSISLIN